MYSWVQKRQRNQRSNCQHLLDHRKSKEIPEKHLFCFTDYTKAFEYVDHNKLWRILEDMGIPDHLTYLLRNLYASQEATVRNGHGRTNWFKIGKGVHQGCILSPCLFNLYAEYIIQNANWMNHKLESRYLREITTSNMQIISLKWEILKRN